MKEVKELELAIEKFLIARGYKKLSDGEKWKSRWAVPAGNIYAGDTVFLDHALHIEKSLLKESRVIY